MNGKIYLDDERKCYFCGRTDEDGKDLFHVFSENVTQTDSFAFFDLCGVFEIKEYDIQLSDFIKMYSLERSAFTDLSPSMQESSITIFACPVCLSVLRQIGSCQGTVV
ncbi:hypothetical protein [Methanococcoides alaskense]|uniref:Uncharacterized protein n=1 Tax=Methanococcoides alaskense TaxID=325778 RepID=A0AA90TXU6_9EURY|nr:hypothetical protein [Methanococcoides alaskense]MDA0525172.1 hypothetical protein [Methanococcoides alaskense]MDR6221907.1 hypothetical protein [Methanococcoides alaskense]